MLNLIGKSEREKYMKRIVSLALSFVMLLTLCNAMIFTSFAEDEVFTATVQGTYEQSESEQDIVVRLELPSVTENYAAFYIDGGIVLPDGFAIKSFTTNNSVQIQATDYFVQTGKLNYDPVNSQNSIPAGTYYDVIITAPANAVGDYEITINSLCATDAAYDPIVSMATLSATLTITEPQGYAAKISAAATNPNPIRVGQTFKVNVGSNMDFASTEITITYPANLVLFDENLSSLGTATINAETAGIIKLADYGADKTAAPNNYVFAFYALNDGEASFSITAAGFGTGESAETADLTSARLPNALGITIDKTQYTVTMDDIFTGNPGVNHGETYYFYPESATGAYYTYYEIIVKKDGQNVNYTNADGRGWKVENVTGNLVITGRRTPSMYGVSWKGDNWSDVTSRPDHATYSKDFTFELPPDQPAGTEDGYRYEVRVEIGTEEYTGYTKDGQKYTIPGADIIDGIDIYVTKVPVYATQYTVTINGESGVVADNYTPPKGSNVVLHLTPEPGYKYEVEVNGAKVNFINNRYTITNVQANVTVNVSKSLDLSSANAVSFATLDATNLYLVLVGNQRIEGKTYTYNGNNMYWSSQYSAYAILVFGTNAPALTDFALITVDVVPTVEYDGDVNGTTNVDANDAQLVYNMYNAKYSAFEGNITMEKFLEADMNGDKEINSEDAVVIINQILNIND